MIERKDGYRPSPGEIEKAEEMVDEMVEEQRAWKESHALEFFRKLMAIESREELVKRGAGVVRHLSEQIPAVAKDGRERLKHPPASDPDRCHVHWTKGMLENAEDILSRFKEKREIDEKWIPLTFKQGYGYEIHLKTTPYDYVAVRSFYLTKDLYEALALRLDEDDREFMEIMRIKATVEEAIGQYKQANATLRYFGVNLDHVKLSRYGQIMLPGQNEEEFY